MKNALFLLVLAFLAVVKMDGQIALGPNMGFLASPFNANGKRFWKPQIQLGGTVVFGEKRHRLLTGFEVAGEQIDAGRFFRWPSQFNPQTGQFDPNLPGEKIIERQLIYSFPLAYRLHFLLENRFSPFIELGGLVGGDFAEEGATRFGDDFFGSRKEAMAGIGLEKSIAKGSFFVLFSARKRFTSSWDNVISPQIKLAWLFDLRGADQ